VQAVNIILFDGAEVSQPLPREDPRARHILDVLQRTLGESFDAGLIDGPRGKGVVDQVTADELILSFTCDTELPAVEMITMIAGWCRPQTSRRVLREAATLGVARMFFVSTERSEATYADSSLWATGEYHRHVRSGVEQAFATRIPAVEVGMGLDEAITSAGGRLHIALDNYEGIMPLHRVELPGDTPLTLAVGSERGWSSKERDLLRSAGYQLAGLGSRVLRAETATIAALAVIKAATGGWDTGPTVDTRV